MKTLTDEQKAAIGQKANSRLSKEDRAVLQPEAFREAGIGMSREPKVFPRTKVPARPIRERQHEEGSKPAQMVALLARPQGVTDHEMREALGPNRNGRLPSHPMPYAMICAWEAGWQIEKQREGMDVRYWAVK